MGQFLAAPAKGTITGFRAGRMFPERVEGEPDAPFKFNGAMIIDDPLKPDDARKKPEREAVNNRYLNTLRSRLADERVPVIVIMQRLDMDDLSGWLLKGGSGEYWHHLMLPGRIDNAADYPSEYKFGIPINHGLPDGPLWRHKLNEEQLNTLSKASFVFASQIQQNPMAAGGAIWKREYFTYCKAADRPNMEYRVIFGDTAQKEGEENDYSVLQLWGKGVDGKAYLLDQVRGKWAAPQLQTNAKFFWAKHRPYVNGRGHLRAMKIEDKVSGTTLIQTLPTVEGGVIPVEAIPRETKDKWTRANDVEPAYANHMVVHPHPDEAPWLTDYETELLGFPSASFDDQVDPTMDAVAEMVGTAQDLMSLL